MEADIKPFKNHRIPKDIEEYLTDKNRKDMVILYMFFVRNDFGRVEPFCYVVTDYNHKLIMYRVLSRGNQNYAKRKRAAEEAISYITD